MHAFRSDYRVGSTQQLRRILEVLLKQLPRRLAQLTPLHKLIDGCLATLSRKNMASQKNKTALVNSLLHHYSDAVTNIVLVNES